MTERRIHQDRAIGYCQALMQEFFAIISTLPVDHNKYDRIAEYIVKEIDLIKKWRTSDNRFKVAIDKNENEVTTEDAYNDKTINYEQVSDFGLGLKDNLMVFDSKKKNNKNENKEHAV